MVCETQYFNMLFLKSRNIITDARRNGPNGQKRSKARQRKAKEHKKKEEIITAAAASAVADTETHTLHKRRLYRI